MIQVSIDCPFNADGEYRVVAKRNDTPMQLQGFQLSHVAFVPAREEAARVSKALGVDDLDVVLEFY